MRRPAHPGADSLRPALPLWALLLFCLTAAPAAAVENGGGEDGAEEPGYEELRDSLLSLPEDADLPARLREAYTSLDDPRESAELIRRFLPLLEEGKARFDALRELARLEESLGQLGTAQLHYQAAAFAATGRERYETLLISAELLMQQGAYRQAELQLKRILEARESGPLRDRARVVLAEVYLLAGEPQRAKEQLTAYGPETLPDSPQLLYQLWVLGQELSLQSLRESAGDLLSSEYPASPESAVVRGEAEPYPNVHTALGLLDSGHRAAHHAGAETAPEREAAREGSGEEGASGTEGSEETAEAIQTGSFRKAENAEHMRRELEDEGFSVTVRSTLIRGKQYFRVLVAIPDGQGTEKMILRLKEAGYEGYPVY